MKYTTHLLSTTQASCLFFNPLTNTCHLTSPLKEEPQHNSNTFEKNQLIVLASDEEITDEPIALYFDDTNQPFIAGRTKKKFNGEIESGSLLNKGLVFCGDSKRFKKIIATSSPKITPFNYLHIDRIKEFVKYWNIHKQLPLFEFDDDIIEPRESINFAAQIQWLPKENEINSELPTQPTSDSLSFRDILVTFFRDATKADYLSALRKAEQELSVKFSDDEIKPKFSDDLNEAAKELTEHWYQKTGSMTAREICNSSLHTGIDFILFAFSLICASTNGFRKSLYCLQSNLIGHGSRPMYAEQAITGIGLSFRFLLSRHWLSLLVQIFH